MTNNLSLEQPKPITFTKQSNTTSLKKIAQFLGKKYSSVSNSGPVKGLQEEDRKNLLDAIVLANQRSGSEPTVIIKELFNEGAEKAAAFIWTQPDTYWGAIFDTRESIQKSFDAAGIKIEAPNNFN